MQKDKLVQKMNTLPKLHEHLFQEFGPSIFEAKESDEFTKSCKSFAKVIQQRTGAPFVLKN